MLFKSIYEQQQLIRYTEQIFMKITLGISARCDDKEEEEEGEKNCVKA